MPSERELDELYWFVGRKVTSKTRENVYLMTMISRNLRLIVGFDVASDKSSKRYKKLLIVHLKLIFIILMNIYDILILFILANTFAMYEIKKILTMLKA